MHHRPRSASLRVLIPLVLCGLGLFGLGCSGSRLSYHSQEELLKRQGASVAVIEDVNIIDDVIGDTTFVDISANKSYGGLILNHVEDRLNAKKYAVSNLVLTSVGLLMDPNRIYRLKSSTIENSEKLPFLRAPFYLNEMIRHDSAFIDQLATTYKTLLTVPVESLISRRFSPVTDSMGSRFQARTIICLILGGHIVPANARLRERPVSVPYGRGLEGVSKVTQVSLTIFILDAEQGTILWSDQAVSKASNVNPHKLLYLADQLIDDLPDYRQPVPPN